jgi:arabinofuranan 3-O-arabinosyltransferase
MIRTQLRRRPSVWLVGVWAISGAALLAETVRAHGVSVFAIDFRPTYFAAKNLRVNGDPYIAVHGQLQFVYPPSCALLFAPITWVGDHAAAFGGMLLAAVALVLIATASGRLSQRRALGPVAAVTLGLLAVSHVGWGTIALGNLSAIMAAGLAWCLALIDEDRWIFAAALFGLTVSVKPLVAVAVLVFILARRWHAVAVAIAVPVALNLITLPLLKRPGDFIHKTIPALKRGDTLPLKYNASIAGFGTRHGIADGVTAVARVLIVAAGVVLISAVLRGSLRIRWAAVATIPVTVLCLAAKLDEAHYDLALIPLVVLVAVTARGWPQRLLAAAAFGFLVFPDLPIGLITVGQLLVLASVAAETFARARITVAT